MQKTLSLRAKTLLSLGLFAVLFATLAVLATFFDLQVSQLLTKNSLAPGEYISSSGFALFFEAVGCVPFYIMPAIAATIAFWFFARKGNKGLYVVAALCAVASVALYTLLFKDLFAYTAEYIGANLAADSAAVLQAKELAGSGYIKAICVVCAAAVTGGVIALWKRVPRATNDKMIWWVLAILCAAAFMLIVHFVKSPIGRVRFRTMNFVGDANFDLFTPWYVLNGKRVLVERSIAGVVGSTPDTKAMLIVASDTCKSFPSGHTFSAAMVYTLLALPYLDDKFNTKGAKLVLWIATVGFTGLVAISRIVAGAHYFSDVLFGGTICFVGAMIAREIFVCKGCHWFALFPRKAQAAQAAGEGNDAPTESAPAEAMAEDEGAETVDEDETVEAAPAEGDEQ